MRGDATQGSCERHGRRERDMECARVAICDFAGAIRCAQEAPHRCECEYGSWDARRDATNVRHGCRPDGRCSVQRLDPKTRLGVQQRGGGCREWGLHHSRGVPRLPTYLHSGSAGERVLQPEDMPPAPVAEKEKNGTPGYQGHCRSQHAGALKHKQDVETREALEWPEVTSHIMEAKSEIDGNSCKRLSKWGRPCIFQGGFDWDLKREGTDPCVYQNKIDGRKAYRGMCCGMQGPYTTPRS